MDEEWISEAQYSNPALIFIVSSRPYWKPAGVFTMLNRQA